MQPERVNGQTTDLRTYRAAPPLLTLVFRGCYRHPIGECATDSSTHLYGLSLSCWVRYPAQCHALLRSRLRK